MQSIIIYLLINWRNIHPGRVRFFPQCDIRVWVGFLSTQILPSRFFSTVFSSFLFPTDCVSTSWIYRHPVDFSPLPFVSTGYQGAKLFRLVVQESKHILPPPDQSPSSDYNSPLWTTIAGYLFTTIPHH
ncbi:hypothetical protein L1887_23629 [Cichorium endivia]|nr:hypothetical protein L1887_23629 [Cichorium endivia]